MFFYHSAKVIDYLCCQINLTLMGVFNQVVVLVFKQLNLCVFDFYQCAGSALVVANEELNSIIVSRLQLTINLYTKTVSVKLAVFLLCCWSDLSVFLTFLA